MLICRKGHHCWRISSLPNAGAPWENLKTIFLENEKVALNAVCLEKLLCHWDFYVYRWLSISTLFFWFITIRIKEKPFKNMLGLSTFPGYVIQSPLNILDSNFSIFWLPILSRTHTREIVPWYFSLGLGENWASITCLPLQLQG